MSLRLSALSSIAFAMLAMAQPAVAQGAANSEDAEIDEFMGDAYVLGNAFWAVYHEAGHMLISELGLPFDGDQERAADVLATLLMVPDPEEEVAQDQGLQNLFRETMIESVAWGWVDKPKILAPGAADTHPPDEDRAANIMCLLYGSAPDYYADLEEFLDSTADCADHFEMADQVWGRVLEPHYLDPDETSESIIEVVYGPASNELAEVADFIEYSGLLELVAYELQGFVALPNDVVFQARQCGHGIDASWNPARRELTLCYELLQSLVDQHEVNVTGYDDRVLVELRQLSGSDDDGDGVQLLGKRRGYAVLRPRPQ